MTTTTTPVVVVVVVVVLLLSSESRSLLYSRDNIPHKSIPILDSPIFCKLEGGGLLFFFFLKP
jgi:hypothetical protein